MRSRKTLRPAVAVIMAVGLAFGLGEVPQAAAAGSPRVDLGVLIVTDGTPWVEAIHQELSTEGVPTTVVNLNDPSRPTINAGYLAGTLSDGTAEAHFQGVVLPNNNPAGMSADELTALASYEARFAVREIDSYVWPNASVGMNTPSYSGTLDATTTTVTSAAKSNSFGYLNGTFTFEGTAGGTESYGYLATPLANTATTSFTPYLTEPIPGGTTTGTLAGVYASAGRQQMEISFGYNFYQLQFRYIAHGLVDWITRGVHFGYWRNWFDVHFDDVFNADAIWSDVGKCTPGDGTCPAGTPDTTPARMTPADVTYAVNWEKANNFTIDLAFNGGADAQFVDPTTGKDPLLTAFKSAGTSKFRWINHTYTHQFLGCVQDFTVIPWRCTTDANGNIVWVSSSTINSEILNNVSWAKNNGIQIDRSELVAGEHSGTLILPQQPVDNPNFDNALGPDKVQVTGLDASREPALRPVGAAMGFPRHPINVFYNVSTQAEEVSEYNWIYTSAANGGSGLCDNSTTTSCIQPLDPSTGWASYILPQQINITLGYVLRNDPRTFYMHQTNLTDDRLAYPVMTGVLNAYRSVYATNSPIVNEHFLNAAQDLNAQQVWGNTMTAGTVHGYIQGTAVTVTGRSGTSVPFTAPNGTVTGCLLILCNSYGSAYGNERSAWTTLGSGAMTLTLPSAPYATA